MPKKLTEILQELANLLHWLGKYGEANEITTLVVSLKKREIETSSGLTQHFEHKALTIASLVLIRDNLEKTLDEAANSDLEGCYGIVQEWNDSN